MESLLRQFLPFERLLAAAPLGSGNINDSYRIDLEQNGVPKTLLLQRLNHQVFKKPETVARNIRAVAEYLSQQENYPYQISLPLAGLDGNDLQRDEAGNFWRVFTFLDHSFVPETAADPDMAFEAAKAYGAFLRALGGFPAERLTETIPGFHDTDHRWTAFEQILKENPAGRAASVQAEIEQLFAAQPVFQALSRLKNSGGLPLRVTHNDTKAGNVLLDASTRKAIAVIDWDTVMPGTVLSDFGDMVRTFVPDAYEDADPVRLGLRTAVLEALCRGFLSETDGFLTKTELENLPLGARWIIGEQALRFLGDYLAGDVYYKTGYPEHNLVRARNQLKIFELVSEAETTIRSFLT